MNARLTNDYWEILKQHKQKVLNAIGICCALSLLSYFVLPRNYKVSATISLQTQYFQLPLVSGFLTETVDPQELRSKREALLRLALNQQFLSHIASKYQLVKDPTSSYELEQLNKKFEIIPNSQSSFVINFNAKDANLAYQVLHEFITHLQDVMTQERHVLLLNLHDAIEEQLESISVGRSSENASSIYSIRPDLVQERMEKIQEEIETLKNSYSEKHPRITALKDELAQLAQWNRPVTENAPLNPKGDVFSGIKVDDASKELFDDLLKKYRYLEVVIYMDKQNKDHYLSYLNEPFIPNAPTWPKIPILLAWGVALGFLIGSIFVLIRETPKFKTTFLPAKADT